jgi:hypothetical protein
MMNETARERWLALSQEQQDAENERRKERGEKAIPTHRHWPAITVHPPIVVHLTPTAIQPYGECLCCGHVLPLGVWKDAPLSDIEVGVCVACRDLAMPNRGPCSSERGCRCLPAAGTPSEDTE